FGSVTGDADARADLNRLLAESIVVERVLKTIVPVGNGLEGRADDALCVILERCSVGDYSLLPVLAHQVVQPRLGRSVSGALDSQVALAFLLRAPVSQQEREYILCHLAVAHQPNRWNDQTLLVNLTRHRHRAGTHTSHIGVVRTIGHIKNRAFSVKTLA